MAALRSATVTLIVVGFALILKAPTVAQLGLGLLAVAIHIAAAYLHDDTEHGLLIGTGLGGAQVLATGFMVTLGMRFFPANCQSICFALVFLSSVAIGFVGGGALVSSSTVGRQRSVASAIALGVPLMTLGCLPGVVGLIMGSVGGLALGLVPGWFLLRPSVRGP
ncbi:MAG: hypothetical protein AAFX94_01110 [Myxococcota bacterium]